MAKALIKFVPAPQVDFDPPFFKNRIVILEENT